ncbi:putative NRPS-like protein biosynthetic cluster [Claviceps citrina]|nr:putative NRPS-like protein biosynthetic cluster [Claviceps citrina]
MQGDQLFTTSITIRHDLDENCAHDGESLGFESVEGEDPHEFDIVLSVVMNGPDNEMSLNYNSGRISQSVASEAAIVFEGAIAYLTDAGNESMQQPLDRAFFKHTTGVAESKADNSLHLKVQYDEQVLNGIQARRLARQFETIVRQLCNHATAMTTLQSINVASEQNLRQIWQWNANVPRTALSCVHDLIAETVHRQPQAQAIDAWDGELTYGELDRLSWQLARHLVQKFEVRPSTIITLCFEKSMWMPVAMLGVMKAGGASVAMDITQPPERLREILRQASSTILLTSRANEAFARGLVDESHEQRTTVLAIQGFFEEDPSPTCQAPSTAVGPQDMLYVVFTSGSTGTPKGIAVSHANFSSAILHQQDMLCYQSSSRVVDFASYAFDVAWYNVLFTLKAGGCLWIPNENDRHGDIAGAIVRLKANYVEWTATVGRLVKAEEVPRLQTIQFCGERLTLSTLYQWRHVEQVFQCYGPAECTAATTINRIVDIGDQDPHIGMGCGTVTWVVSTRRCGLASVGEVGELWVEGPLVAMGYLNSPGRTSSSFVEDPAWLLQGGPGIPGRHGRLGLT